MAEKLRAGAPFPALALPRTDGSTLSIPADLGLNHHVVLFYRGHW